MKYEIWKHQDLGPNFGAIYLEFRTLYFNLKWFNNWSDRNHRYRAWGLYQSFPSPSESFFLLREMWLKRVGGCWRGVGCEINGLISLYQDLTRQLHFSEIWQTDAGGGQGGRERTVNDIRRKGKSTLTRAPATQIFWNHILENQLMCLMFGDVQKHLDSL